MALRFRRNDCWRLLILGTCGALSSMVAYGSPDRSSVEASWRFVASPSNRGETPRVLAWGKSDNRIALADDAGVSILQDAESQRAALVDVRDLAFDREGTLWIATDDGLYRWEDSGRPVRRWLRGGENANRISRIVANPLGMVVATESGAFWSTSGDVFQTLAVGSASAPAKLVAIEPEASNLSWSDFDSSDPFGSDRSDRLAAGPGEGGGRGSETASKRLWIVQSGRLIEVEGFIVDAGMRVISTRARPLPRMMGDREPVDLFVDTASDRLVLVFEDAVASRSLTGDSSRGESESWHIERPVLPPGAVIRRLGRSADGRVVIATDHGLIEGASFSGSFLRSTHPLGSSDCTSVAGGGERGLMVLCRRGVYLRSTESSGAEVSESRIMPTARIHRPSVHLAPDPPLSEIRSRAIERAGLSVARSRRLRQGLHRRGYWPELSLRLESDLDRDRQSNSDESFVSGQTRHLLDQRRDRSFGFGATIEFDWDLGGVVYPDDAVDLSREMRLVVSLRDDISDEINQLYFERQGIRERLLSSEPIPDADEIRLRLRAEEIDAGLDAWTGGWVNSWRSTQSTRHSQGDPAGDG